MQLNTGGTLDAMRQESGTESFKRDLNSPQFNILVGQQ